MELQREYQTMPPIQRAVSFGGPILLALLASAGCSRPFETPAEGATNDVRAPLRTAQTTPASAVERLSTVPAANRQQTLPFQPSQDVPAGTLLTVRLQSPIEVRVPIMVDSFQAVVEEPVVIDGNTLIPRGTSVAGHVETVFVSQTEPRRGYVGLELDSLHVSEGDVAVQTSNLFARQSSANGKTSSKSQLERGRRLTFRLTEPISLILRSAQTSR
jgi:hypothetical protein